jgi:hypothetical protein
MIEKEEVPFDDVSQYARVNYFFIIYYRALGHYLN